MTEPALCNSINAPSPVADYAHAVEIPLGTGHSLLYICGMGPREKNKKIVPGVTLDDKGNVISYDIEKQTRNVFENIDTVIKDAGGRGLRDVVDVQVFLLDIPRDFQTFNKVWKEYVVFEDGWMPARTTVEVSALPLKEIFVELKCSAVIKRG
jgi:2-aminomuconate deaminase